MDKLELVATILTDYYTNGRKFMGKQPLRTIWHRSVMCDNQSIEYFIFFNDHKYSVTINESDIHSAYHSAQCAINKFDYMIKSTTPKGAY